MPDSVIAKNNRPVSFRTKPLREKSRGLKALKIKKLPTHIRKAHKSGLISEAALKKHFAE